MRREENEERIQEFHRFLDDLCGNKAISAEAMKRFSKQTEVLMAQHEKRMNEFLKQSGLKETPIEISMIDHDILYGTG